MIDVSKEAKNWEQDGGVAMSVTFTSRQHCARSGPPPDVQSGGPQNEAQGGYPGKSLRGYGNDPRPFLIG